MLIADQVSQLGARSVCQLSEVCSALNCVPNPLVSVGQSAVDAIPVVLLSKYWELLVISCSCACFLTIFGTRFAQVQGKFSSPPLCPASLFSTLSMRDESSHHQLEVSVDPAVLSDRLAEAEAELETLRRELEHASRLATLGTIAAGIAHEINNVLTPVLAYAQLASQHPDDQSLQRKALHKARLGAEAATQIVQAILGYAAASDDEPAVASLHDVMQQTMELLTRDLAKDRIKLTLRVPDGVQVCMKPLALQQVLLNLILNARAALANQRCGEVVISAMERSDGMTAIRVSDNGPGIPEDVVGRLFQPFVNAGSPRSGGRKKKGGAGLGLSICRRLIENVHGTITASSTPNAGTTFTITLPTARNQRAIAG